MVSAVATDGVGRHVRSFFNTCVGPTGMPMSPEVILEFPHLVGTLLRVPICELDRAALAVRALEPASVNPALGDKQSSASRCASATEL